MEGFEVFTLEPRDIPVIQNAIRASATILGPFGCQNRLEEIKDHRGAYGLFKKGLLLLKKISVDL